MADLWQPADDAFDAIATFLRRSDVPVDFPKPGMDMHEASSLGVLWYLVVSRCVQRCPVVPSGVSGIQWRQEDAGRKDGV